ncbi:hypothetical protein ACTXT7_014355 [Hymenolepis weldensis]
MKPNEIPMKATGLSTDRALRKLYHQLQNMRSHDFPRNYAPLYLPHSLSYSLQLTYRDGKLANVPASLLVEGDIIKLRPGQTICCDCVLITEGSDDYSVRYSVGDTFLPHLAGNFTSRNPYPSVHLMDSCHLAIVTSSPAVELIKSILKRRASNQKTQIQNTSSFVFLKGSVLCSVITAIVFLFAGIIISSIRVSVQNHSVLSADSIIHCKSDRTSVFKKFLKSMFIQPESQTEQLLLHLGQISRMCFVDKKGIISLPIPTPEKLFFFRDRPNRHHKTVRMRSFGHNSSHQSNEFTVHHVPSSNSFGASNGAQPESRNFLSLGSNGGSVVKPHSPRNSIQNNYCTPEILNINVTLDCLYKPRFESPRWGRFLDCLKPIGLNLLLNNCQSLTYEHYAAFADHLTRLTVAGRNRYSTKEDSQTDGETVATVNNRCLCGLAYQMGFRQSALENYSFAASLGIYKAIEKSNNHIRRGKMDGRGGGEDENLLYFRSQALRIQEAYASVPKDNANEPLPVPNCFCTIYREATSCGYHVMSQGSGDLITALCTNFWNGRELLPIMDEERNRMLDFYYLNVSTSYCMAFSYMPLLQSMPLVQNTRPDSKFANQIHFPVLKLPVNFELRSRLTTRPSSTISMHPGDSLDSISLLQRPKRRPTRKELPTCVTVANDLAVPLKKISNVERKSKPPSTPIGGLPRVAFSCGSLPRLSCQTSSSSNSTSDFSVDSAALQDAFSKQTFLGMVSLQYQAMPGIVETIRKLNQACIRFVHFSQDNQLRSRVFAERLGLEADWNCHISLAEPPSEASRSTSRTSNRIGQLASTTSAATLNTSSNSRVRETSFSLNHGGVGVFKRPYSLSSPNVTRLGILRRKSFSAVQSSISKALDSSVPLIDSSEAGSNSIDDVWIGFDMDSDAPEGIKQAPQATDEVSSYNSLPGNDDGKKSTTSDDSIFNDSESSTSASTFSVKSACDNVQEEEDAYNYVFANKSRLPSGIKNIRTHLQNVDNVPLKVSLFTDCTPSAVDEMICIMQEYGETVCVVGSCLSIANAELFCRGDTAIALFPLLPLVCGHDRDQGRENADITRPLLNLAGRLIALGANLVSHASLVELDILQLITQAHASVNNIHLCITFAIAASFASALFYLLSLALLPAFPLRFRTTNELIWLPPILLGTNGPISSPHSELVGHVAISGRVLWLNGIVIPLLAISTFGRMVERNKPLQQPPVKRNEIFSKDRMLRLFWVTAARFLPSVVVCWLVGMAQTIIVCPTAIDYRLACLTNNKSGNVSSSLSEPSDHADVLLDAVLSQEIPFFLLVVSLATRIEVNGFINGDEILTYPG